MNDIAPKIDGLIFKEVEVEDKNFKKWECELSSFLKITIKYYFDTPSAIIAWGHVEYKNIVIIRSDNFGDDVFNLKDPQGVANDIVEALRELGDALSFCSSRCVG